MKAKPQTKMFQFILNNEQTLSNIDHLKMNDYEKFKQLNKLGCRICELAKSNDWQQLESTFDLNSTLIPFLKLEIQNAFVSALNLRQFQTVKYFLQNGFNIEIVAEDAVLTICYTLQYLKNDNTPLQLLQLLLSYGANPRAASSWGSQTAMHLAAQYNNTLFLDLLLQYGGDIDAVNDDRQTPLGLAIRNKSQAAIHFLKGKGARAKWNE